MMKMYYFINYQPRFASLYADTKSQDLQKGDPVQKNLKSVSNTIKPIEFST